MWPSRHVLKGRGFQPRRRSAVSISALAAGEGCRGEASFSTSRKAGSIRRGLRCELKKVAEKLLHGADIPSAAEAVIHFTRVTVRLEAAPFQNKSKVRVLSAAPSASEARCGDADAALGPV